jgi:hypothetical protein
MKAKVSSRLVLGSMIAWAALASAAPPAREYKTALTTPTSGASTTIKISKASRAGAKIGTGVVTFYLKLSGVVDSTTGDPITLAGNTFEVQVLVNGMTRTADFSFDMAGGKTVPSNLKVPVALGDTAVWGSVLAVGQPVEVRRVRVIEAGTGMDFGVAGITVK